MKIKKIVKFLILILTLANYSCGNKKESDTSEKKAETKNSDTINNTQVEDNKPTEWTCNICNNKFTGNGYQLDYEGNCKELDKDHQGFLCSCSCAKKARNNFNNAVDNAEDYEKNNKH